MLTCTLLCPNSWRNGETMGFDPEGMWVNDAVPVAPPSRCVWVKVTQLLGEVSCYLLPVHDGNHCSSDWIEWT
jgi:hypothetical protein